MRSKIVTFISFLAVFLLGGLSMYGIVLLFPIENTSTKIPSGNVDSGSGSILNSANYEKTVIVNNSGISESVNKAYDSVVMIENYKKKSLSGTGSGFVYKTDDKYGYIMTNQHVVDGCTSLKVLFANGEKVDATLLGGDEYLDIAVVRVNVKYVLSKLAIGSTENLKRGETIFTIGSPVGEEYYNTVTSGIISGLDRLVTVSVNSTNDWIQEVIQVDAAINPGNSGGPLLNVNGEVIGINSLKLVDSSIESMGFAIKIEDAMQHVDILESGNKIERPLLGIELLNVTDTYSLLRNGITLDDDIEYGIVVVNLMEGTGASKSDLEKGDVIVAIGEDKVTDSAYLKYLLYKYNAGDSIEITYIRDGKAHKTTVVLTVNED